MCRKAAGIVLNASQKGARLSVSASFAKPKIRLFRIDSTEQMLKSPEFRALVLPVVRAEFQIAFKYRYCQEAPWNFPIACFNGEDDLYVTRADISCRYRCGNTLILRVTHVASVSRRLHQAAEELKKRLKQL